MRDLWSGAPGQSVLPEGHLGLRQLFGELAHATAVRPVCRVGDQLRGASFYNTFSADGHSVTRGLTSVTRRSTSDRCVDGRWATASRIAARSAAMPGSAGSPSPKNSPSIPYYVRYPTLSLSTPIAVPSVMEVLRQRPGCQPGASRAGTTRCPEPSTDDGPERCPRHRSRRVRSDPRAVLNLLPDVDCARTRRAGLSVQRRFSSPRRRRQELGLPHAGRARPSSRRRHQRLHSRRPLRDASRPTVQRRSLGEPAIAVWPARDSGLGEPAARAVGHRRACIVHLYRPPGQRRRLDDVRQPALCDAHAESAQ